MKSLLILFTIAVLTLPSKLAFADEIDSLKQLVTRVEGEEKADMLNTICWKLRNSNPSESLRYGQEGIEYSEEINYDKGRMRGYSFAGVAYRNLGRYAKAFEYYYEGLNIAKKLDDKEQQGYAYINLGNLYIYQDQLESARDNLLQSMSIARELNNQNMVGYATINLGRVFTMLGEYEKAHENIEEALRIRIGKNDAEGIAVCYKYKGDIYLAQQISDSALLYYRKATGIIDLTNDKDLLADAYNNIAKVNIERNQLDTALYYATLSLDITKELGSVLRIKNTYETLSELSEMAGDYKNQSQYLKKIQIYKDSLFTEEVSKKIANIEFESIKRQKIAQLEIHDLELRRQELYVNALTGMLSLGILLGIVMTIWIVKSMRVNKLLKKQQEEMNYANDLLFQSNEELEQQRDNLEEMNQEMDTQRQLLSNKNNQITDSILYAKRIQQAVLPPEASLQRYFPEYFVFYKPKDIVSGDFYWVTQKANTVFLAVADCTGHGVPGAFMSILSISFLNEIIIRNLKNILSNKLSAGEILDQLRTMVKKSLQQDKKDISLKDGLDISFSLINTEEKTVQFAGAHNSLLILQGKTITEIKGDRMPVSVHRKESPFTTKHIKLASADKLYMSTDGYKDQIGEKNSRKFMAKRFTDLLIETSVLHMNDQKNAVEKTLADWQGNKHQVDDILVVGVVIP